MLHDTDLHYGSLMLVVSDMMATHLVTMALISHGICMICHGIVSTVYTLANIEELPPCILKQEDQNLVLRWS